MEKEVNLPEIIQNQNNMIKYNKEENILEVI